MTLTVRHLQKIKKESDSNFNTKDISPLDCKPDEIMYPSQLPSFLNTKNPDDSRCNPSIPMGQPLAISKNFDVGTKPRSSDNAIDIVTNANQP